MRYLALGDSYTIGEGVPAAKRWPEVLVRRMNRHGTKVDEVTVIAQTGWTTSEFLEALANEDVHPRYDLVTLLLGVNNQYRGLSVDAYMAEFNQCLTKAIHYAQGRANDVCVVSIPDWGVSPFAEGKDRAQIAHQVDAFNAVNKTLTYRAGARYADITPLSRTLSESYYFAEDGLHPSGIAYEKWVDVIWGVVG